MIGQAAQREVTPDDASTFARLWEEYTAIWPRFLGLKGQLADHAAQWRELSTRLYRAGDVEGFRALQAKARQIEQLEAERAKAEDNVRRFRDAWETMRSYLRSALSWTGLRGPGPGLGLPPLLLLVAVPTAIAALAYVVTAFRKISAELTHDRDMLEAVKTGQLTPQAAATMRRPPDEGLAGTLKSVALWGGVILVGLYAAPLLFRSRRT